MHVSARQNPVAPPAEVRATAEELVVATLYDKGLLDNREVQKAAIYLKLNLDVLSDLLGYENRGEFLASLGTTHEEKPPEKEEEGRGWTIWNFQEMQRLVDLYYGEGRSASDTAEALAKTNPARTYKSVKGFLRRTFELGVHVDKHIWDLLEEGYDAEAIATAGYNSVRAEFAQHIHQLRRYCATLYRAPEPVILFKE